MEEYKQREIAARLRSIQYSIREVEQQLLSIRETIKTSPDKDKYQQVERTLMRTESRLNSIEGTLLQIQAVEAK